MKVAFLGTPAVALPALDALVGAGHDVRLVVCRPDRPVGRSGRAHPPATKTWATDRGIDVFQPTKVRHPSFGARLAAAEPDVVVVVAYGRILGRKALSLARHGAVNVHFSLLPAYRGAAPVQWALARGESRTGVTTMRMSEGLDEGDILLQSSTEILADEHAPELAARLAVAGGDLLVRTLSGLAAGELRATPQDPAAATYAPLLTREDGVADPRLPAAELAGRIRGFDPWPGVWGALDGRRVRWVRGVALAAGGAGSRGGRSAETPGRVLAAGSDGIDVACGRGVLRLTEVQLEGRRAVSAADAVRGRLLSAGDRFDVPDAPQR